MLKKVNRAIKFNKKLGYNHTLIWIQIEFSQVDEWCKFRKNSEKGNKSQSNKPIATKRRRNYFAMETNYYNKVFLDIELKRTQIFINKPVCLGLSILEISKLVTYEFWYDYVKQKYGEKAKLGFVHTESLIIYIETEDIYMDSEKDVETRFNNSNYKLDRKLPKQKNKKLIGLIKDR